MNTIINNVNLVAVNSWLPQTNVELRSLSSLYGDAEVESIIKATGVERVRIADETMTSSDMCFYAAEALFEKEQLDRSRIDGLVFVSQTSDWILPATSISLQDRLGLSKDVVCIDIHYGCSGYIYGLFQAASSDVLYAQAGRLAFSLSFLCCSGSEHGLETGMTDWKKYGSLD